MHRLGTLTGLLLPLALIGVGAYFTFTAVQGDHGLFQRVQAEARLRDLQADLALLETDIARLENLTRRLSDDYLDLDLLDERVRVMLGYIRADDIVLP
ncbi:MAG: septum formation initiator family protein [Rhodobacteraceae bacterium]|jgi:cell division protein FtsB|nr:septum formation initiator family protein [Paracoccaceae bacterium]